MLLSIGGEIIEIIGNDYLTKPIKFVGVNIDENLSWNTHINKVKSKISLASLHIYKLKNIFPTKTLVNLYNGLFRPHIEFGLLAWGGVQPSKLKGFINCQKNVYEISTNAKIDYNCKLFMHSFVYNKLPSCFESMFKWCYGNASTWKRLNTETDPKVSLGPFPSFFKNYRKSLKN